MNDSANLFGINDESDMVVISGTGSVVFVKENGNYTRIGGWGYLFDKAGSSYDIGKSALQVALYEEDFHKEPSAVTLLLRKELKSIFSVYKKFSYGRYISILP